jgi:hypothetical protein
VISRRVQVVVGARIDIEAGVGARGGLAGMAMAVSDRGPEMDSRSDSGYSVL